MQRLLTADQMRTLEQAVFASGRMTSLEAMERAGRAVVDELLKRQPEPGKALVLCGPGNNGGDGYVIARLLKQTHWDVTVATWGASGSASDDAKTMREKWTGASRTLTPSCADDCDVVIDALFGTGQSRSFAPGFSAVLPQHLALPRRKTKPLVIAVDTPTGFATDTGALLTPAPIYADVTVVIGALKRCHGLFPAMPTCGELVVHPIGLTGTDEWPGETQDYLFRIAAADDIVSSCLPDDDAHKHARGHAFVRSGGLTSTGAARLAAAAAARLTGLVTVLSPAEALLVNASHLTSIMLERCDEADAITKRLKDGRNAAILIGPANGVGEATCLAALAALASGKPVVLDADALTSFADDPARLFAAIRADVRPAVLTPHCGEFARLFPDLALDGDRVAAVRAAANRSGAIVLLKGPDTLVAAPDHADPRGPFPVFVNTHAAPWLATAGSGDVLAGIITALLSLGNETPVLDVCSAAWLHGEAGIRCGPGLIAEDLPEALPGILRDLFQNQQETPLV
jgi:ADP-dependent NAD(P)H-hydrate dehydratase / NAD(P)H-hydrate epimerase